MSIFELWLLTTAIPGVDGVMTLLLGGLLVFGLTLGILYVFTYDIYDEATKSIAAFTKRNVKKYALCAVVLSLFSALLPSERQMLLIAGGYTATNNAEIKKLPTNAAKAVNAWLDAVTEAAEVKKK